MSDGASPEKKNGSIQGLHIHVTGPLPMGGVRLEWQAH
jgi:hypothetical protein